MGSSDSRETRDDTGAGGPAFASGEYDKVLAARIVCWMVCCECACLRGRCRRRRSQSSSDSDSGSPLSPALPARTRGVLWIGPEGSGKSTTLERATRLGTPWAQGAIADMAPTKGFSIRETVRHGTLLRVWDMGGSEKIAKHWHRYLHEAHGIVFVADGRSGQLAALDQALALLRDFLASNHGSSHVPLAVLVNCDSDSAMDITCRSPAAFTDAQVMAALGRTLGGLLPYHCAVFLVKPAPKGCSAEEAGTLAVALDWLCKAL